MYGINSGVETETVNTGAVSRQSYAPAVVGLVLWIGLVVIGAIAVSGVQSPALAWAGLGIGVLSIALTCYGYYRQRQIAGLIIGIAFQAITVGLTLAAGLGKLPLPDMGKGLLITNLIGLAIVLPCALCALCCAGGAACLLNKAAKQAAAAEETSVDLDTGRRSLRGRTRQQGYNQDVANTLRGRIRQQGYNYNKDVANALREGMSALRDVQAQFA